MKLRNLKKPRMFRGWKEYSKELIIIRFKNKSFGILKKIKNEWMLGYITYKELKISVFTHEPILNGNSFIINRKIVPLSYIEFTQKVYFYMNPKIKINIGFTNNRNLILMPI